MSTILCPSDELCGYGQHLFSGWEIDEYCEAISEIHHNWRMRYFFFSPDTVRVITLAHKMVQLQTLPTLRLMMFSQYDPSIGLDIELVEAPVDKESGEPLAEDRVVPFYS